MYGTSDSRKSLGWYNQDLSVKVNMIVNETSRSLAAADDNVDEVQWNIDLAIFSFAAPEVMVEVKNGE